MSHKRFKHKRLPICYKFSNACLHEQNLKVIEEFMEQQEKYMNIDNKLRAKQNLTYRDIEKFAMELFDLSQAAQQCIFLLERQFGNHFCFNADKIFEKGIQKNKLRGYYEKN